MLNKLDLKDKRLLYELDLDSRQSFNELGKKLSLSKSSVIYRINNMQKSGIIKQYHTVLDIGKLGYISFRLYIKLQNSTPEKEQEIIDFLKNKEIVTWIVSVDGDYNIGCLILVKTISEMNVLWKELLKKYVNYLEERQLTIMTKVAYFSRAYLLDLKENIYEINFITEPRNIDIDDTDKEILKLLVPNARISIIEVSRKLKITPKTTINRVKALEQKKIIIGYKTVFNLELLGYQYYKVLFRLHNVVNEKLQQFKRYIKVHPNIVYDDEVLGGDDIEIEVQVKDNNELRALINDIKLKFADMIKSYKILLFYKEHKYLYLPVKI